MELKPLFYYVAITRTLNLSNDKWKIVYLDQYLPIKIPKSLWDNNIHTLQDEKKLL